MNLKEILTGKHSRFILCALLIFFIGLSVSAEQSIRAITATGTGFIVSSKGYILTNEHVIHGATKITVTINGQDYKAEVAKDDPNKDIALLKVEEDGLPAVRLGNSEEIQINDRVIAIGCPAGICGTVTQGRVANTDVSKSNLIMVDLTITYGSSGGPLLNTKGEVIGITSAGLEVEDKPTGFSLAIPINQAIPLLHSIPGFSTSEMGQAPEELSLEEIKRQAGAATIFVKAVIEQPLGSFLPLEVLNIELPFIVTPPSFVSPKGPASYFPGFSEAPITDPIGYLVGHDIPVESEEYTVAGITYHSYKFQIIGTWEKLPKKGRVGIGVFDFENESDARKASSVLMEPFVSASPPHTIYSFIWKRSKSLDGLTLNTALMWTVFGYKHSRNLYFKGIATFHLRDLTFLIILAELSSQVSSKKCIRESSYDFINNMEQIEWTIEECECWEEPVGEGLAKTCYSGCSSRHLIIDSHLDSFLNDFESVINSTVDAATHPNPARAERPSVKPPLPEIPEEPFEEPLW